MRIKKFTFFYEIAVAVLLVLTAAGCTAQNNDPQTNNEDPRKPTSALEVTDADNGTKVELQIGQELIITLESNPTTGYSWQLAELQGGVLSQIGEVEFLSEAEGDLVGAGGVEIFRFAAAQAGTTTLELGYLRPWEDGVAPEKEFNLTVVVVD